MAEVAAQHAQFLRERGDALIPRRRIVARRTGIGDRVGQARGVGFRPGRLGDPLGGFTTAWRLPAVQCYRAAPQRRDVAGRKPPPRTGEHPHCRRTGGRVGNQPQHRNHVGDLGYRQQSGQPDHLHRDAAGTQRSGHRCGVGVTSHQDRGGRRRNPVAGGLLITLLQMIGDPLPFGLHVGQQRAADGSGRGVGARAKRANRHRSSPRICGDGVGHMQRPWWVAPAGSQFQDRRRAAVGSREVGGEPGQIGRRGAAPAIDGLDRVADGGQRQLIVDAAAEQ